MASRSPVRRLAIDVAGIVQGVGFRPFVYQLAVGLGLRGWVRNRPEGVEIQIEGCGSALDRFVSQLRSEHPTGAMIADLHLREIDPLHSAQFVIDSSVSDGSREPSIPPDLAMCDACRDEIRSPGTRRFSYPFTSCSHCGPRYSIIEALPYDRSRTAMRKFQMCPECAREYHDPADRRFHAQPIACPSCGPRLELLSGNDELASGENALQLAVEGLRQGLIVGLQGLGGFQLLVDAADAAAVIRLRDRKARPAKPFAVMFPSLETVGAVCRLSSEEAALMSSAQSPIVLLRRRGAHPPGDGPVEFAAKEAQVCVEVAPNNPDLGAMLPYTPLHQLLLERFGAPLVCTSGNISDEPICIDVAEAQQCLAVIADLLLVHDRPISRPVDDSLVRIGSGGFQIIRRARGYAPVAIDIGRDGPPILAAGPHLKNTVALAVGSKAILSQHIGNLDTPAARLALGRAIDDLLDFYGVTPEAIACDLHPDYASTREAERRATLFGAPLIRVQHHHAHIAACIAENRLKDPVLGVAWDGAGYGDDGTIWGGEALVCRGAEFRRAASMRAFALPGGERAIREPRRAAIGLLYSCSRDAAQRFARRWYGESRADLLMKMIERGVNSPLTSSVGRLFDAVAALTGVASDCSYEGQAAMQLEYALGHAAPGKPAYRIELQGCAPIIGDWRPLVEALLSDLAAGVPSRLISARFHNALVEFVVAVARQLGIANVVVTGGCFQNQYLLGVATARLRAEGFNPCTPRMVPVNDGGIALGQVFVARQRLREVQNVPGNSGENPEY